MGKQIPPSIIASMIAGGGIGISAGFLTKSEELEEYGVPLSKQVTGGLGYGLKDGIIGTGIGAGASGTAIALKHIFRKE